jgi:transcriptional regulator
MWRPYPLRFYKACRIVTLVEAQGGHLTNPSLDLPQGTVDLLILKALSLQAMHGWAIAQRIHQVSRTALEIPQGSLYPALHRLERRGWIRAEWGVSDNNRKAKFYQLTRTGRKQLVAESEDWARLTTAVALVLDMG